MPGLRPLPFFVGDDLALDFLNSVAAPSGEQIDWLASGRDLLRWLEEAQAAPTHVLEQFAKNSDEKALDSVAADGRKLREWFRGFVSAHAGRPLEPSVVGKLAPLNERLRRDEIYRQVQGGNISTSGETKLGSVGALHWQDERRWRTPDSLLLPVAQAMGDLVCRKDFSFVRRCENSKCTLWFVDVSKSHARRWCSMAVCGNRAKAASRRARTRALSSKPIRLA